MSRNTTDPIVRCEGGRGLYPCATRAPMSEMYFDGERWYCEDHQDQMEARGDATEIVMRGYWFESEPGLLYIIPESDDDDMRGPDDAIMGELLAAWREGLRGQDYIDFATQRLGLLYVYPPLRRFSPEDGYYHA